MTYAPSDPLLQNIHAIPDYKGPSVRLLFAFQSNGFADFSYVVLLLSTWLDCSDKE